jgi:pilus assembly protein CpaD
MTSLYFKRAAGGAGLGLLLMLGGCGGVAENRMLTSVNQPVVSHNNFTLDVITGPGGLSRAEAARISGWFDALGLRYGDRVALDDPLKNEGTMLALADLVGRRGLQISREVPVGEGNVNAGLARIIVTRAVATVPNCPNWADNNESNFNNATSHNYGCAVNGNLAAMVADPDHLLSGARAKGQTVVMTSNKAIDAYRAAAPSGAGGTAVKKVATGGGS